MVLMVLQATQDFDLRWRCPVTGMGRVISSTSGWYGSPQQTEDLSQRSVAAAARAESRVPEPNERMRALNPGSSCWLTWQSRVAGEICWDQLDAKCRPCIQRRHSTAHPDLQVECRAFRLAGDDRVYVRRSVAARGEAWLSVVIDVICNAHYNQFQLDYWRALLPRFARHPRRQCRSSAPSSKVSDRDL